MRRLFLLGLVSSLFLASSARAMEPVSIEAAEGDPPRIEVISSDERGVELFFELSELVTEDVTAEGEHFQLVSIPGGGFAGEVGEPAIPVFTRLVAVPDGAEVEIRVTALEEEELSGYRLVPMQAGDGSAFAYDPETYSGVRLGDEARVRAGEAGVLRDLRVVDLAFRPVEFSPAEGTLRVARRMQVEIDFVGGEDPARPRTPRPSIPPSFDQLYRSLVLNYEGPAGDTPVAPGTYLVICLDDAAVTAELQDLLDWRKRKGMPTILATTAETGTTREAIKSYIQTVYDDPESSLEYVVFAGDATGSYAIPTWTEYLSGHQGEGDLPYSRLEGADFLPDVHVGRLSFEDLPTLGWIVDKIIGYERNPYVSEPDWFTRSCIVGDPNDSGWSTVETGRWLALRLSEIGFAEADTIFYSPFVSQMQTALNRGDTIFGYRGFYGVSGWSNGYTNLLTNGWKMPFAVILTCETGSFAHGTARSEAFLRAWNESAGEPRAAIGCIGLATGGTHTRYNNCLYYGIWRGPTEEQLYTMGAALTRGCLEMYLNYHVAEPNVPEIWSHWANLMGDPAVDVWTGYPESLDVAHPATLPRGVNSVIVTVSEGTDPVEGAQVCLWKGDETYAVRFTDAQGAVELPATTATAGDMLLTVTKHDKHPYLATIPVTAESVYVGYAASAIDDDLIGESKGNGDGEVNPGETIELGVELENFGSESAPGVEASFTTEDPFLTILDDHESFGDIVGGGTAWSADDFGFALSYDCPHGHVISFGVDVTSGADEWHSLVELEVISAELAAQSSTVYDGGNGQLDPGETVDLSVELHNGGGAPAADVTGTLISLGARVTVTDSTGSFGTIPVGGEGENTTNRYTVTADPGTYQGYLANFSLVTSFSGGTTDTTHLSLTVGSCDSTDPIGPDAYGYYAFEDTDTSYAEAPGYQWVELDPALGGDGMEVPLTDYGEYQDESSVVELPFPFRYYGQTYTQATICSNGWLAMGSTHLSAYRNWSIPGAGGPNGMLAVFWDDLYQLPESKVLQKYDAANHRWIVEWSRLRNSIMGFEETFEAILYDPVYYATDTGDGLIVYQYQTVRNSDYRDGYATVGIESPDQLDGLLYTYFNDYPAGASGLATVRAIRFVPVADGPLGTLQGDILNASNENSPIEGAEVEVLGADRTFFSRADGGYSGYVSPGTYSVAVHHFSFPPDTAHGVSVEEDQSTELDFYLPDIAAPGVTTVAHRSTDDITGPYPIPVTIEEYSDLADGVLHYSTGSPEFTPLTLVPQGGDEYLAEIPGQPYTTMVSYYVYARDELGLEATDPPGAPAELHIFTVAPRETLIDDAFETETGWTIGAPDDDAFDGIWIRAEPVGTVIGESQVQPEYDHTIEPGEICFVTANGEPGGGAGLDDVDGGKTTLLSPIFDLRGYDDVVASYWVWYSNDRGFNPSEDYWVVEVTANGTDWVTLEHTTQTTAESWAEREFILTDLLPMTDQVRFRFVAADEAGTSIVEAAVDDFRITGLPQMLTEVETERVPVVCPENGLAPCRPNPFSPSTRITYRLREPGTVGLRVFDVSGRLVKTLIEGRTEAGEHHLRWDGRNAGGTRVAAGVYFVRLETARFTQARRLVLLR